MSVILHPWFLSLYYFSWHSGLAFSALKVPLQQIGLELGASDSFLLREMRCTSLGACHYLSITSWLTSADYWYFKLFTRRWFLLLLYVAVYLMKPKPDNVISINISLSRTVSLLPCTSSPGVISSCVFELQPRCQLPTRMPHKVIWTSRTTLSWSFAIPLPTVKPHYNSIHRYLGKNINSSLDTHEFTIPPLNIDVDATGGLSPHATKKKSDSYVENYHTQP